VLPLVGQLGPAVVLLDMHMPGIDGLACIDLIRGRHPDVKIVACSSEADPEQIQAAFNHGACGYIVKSVDERDFASAIRQAVNGTAYHALGLPSMDDSSIARAAGLSERELEIMRAVTGGLSNKAIAQKLWVTEQTVKFHLTNIYRKLGVSNRTEAARWALAKGLKVDAQEFQNVG
jgi:DNA-binding NarL/FixJ family response regulator